MIKQMHSAAASPDSELRIAGLPATRAQFNVVYADLVDYLHTIERYTGQRPKDVDLEGVTVFTESLKWGSGYVDVYRGRYLGKLVSGTVDVRGVMYILNILRIGRCQVLA